MSARAVQGEPGTVTPAPDAPAGGGRARGRRRLGGTAAYLLLPGGLVVVLLLIVPVVLLIARSFSGNPPGTAGLTPLTLDNYGKVLSSFAYYAGNAGKTLLLAALGSLLGAVVAFPLAMGIVTSRSRGLRFFYVFMALTPLLVSVVIRSFGWQIILGPTGPVGQLTGASNGLLSTNTAIVIGLAHLATPFVLLALIPAVDAMDRSLIRAARGLGASSVTILARVVLPICAPALIAGLLISFSVCATVIVTPQLLGGRVNVTFPNLVYDQMVTFYDWNLAAALATILMLLIAVVAVLVTVAEQRLSPLSRARRAVADMSSRAPAKGGMSR